jgi:hypothetical protein
VGFVVDKVAMELTSVLVLQVSSVSIVSPELQTHNFEMRLCIIKLKARWIISQNTTKMY